MTIGFTVYGVPMPKGSKTAVVRGGVATLLDARRGPSRKAFAIWTESIRKMAASCVVNGAPMDGPLCVTARFFFPRPKTETRAQRLRIYKTTKPDLDKLLRALLDPMTVSEKNPGGLIKDDARVVSFNGSEKRYVDAAWFFGAPGPRVEVSVSRLQETL